MKVIITGPTLSEKYNISSGLIKLRPGEYISPKYFTTNINTQDCRLQLLTNEDINLGYKNNAFLYFNYDKNENTYFGITIEEFYKSNVITLELSEFEKLSEYIIDKNELIIVWTDTKRKPNNQKELSKDIEGTKDLQDRINYSKINYLYFCDELTLNIVKVIDEFILNEENRPEIIAKYC